MYVDFSEAEEDLNSLEEQREEAIKEEVKTMAQESIPDPEGYDVELINWDGEFHYRLKLQQPERELDHRVLFRIQGSGPGTCLEVFGVFHRDNLDY